MKPRYAIFYAPAPDGPLWQFGCETIGYDALTGADVPAPAGAPFDGPDWPQLTAEPRRYGFHGTLKAPFHLAAGRDEASLVAALADFSSGRRPFAIASLGVAALGRFVALVPGTATPALHTLADAAVRAFEPFRAPLDGADRARRLASPLSEPQVRYLDRWGYPYVFDEFRFHMTLTGALPPDLREPARTALAERYAALGAGEEVVDALSLFRQDDRAGRFRIVARLPFGA